MIGSTYSIKSSSKDIEEALQQKPSEAYAILHLLYAVDFEAMKDRNDCGKAHGHEHAGSIRPPCGCPELVKDRDSSTAQP
jgi:hypothetical protein